MPCAHPPPPRVAQVIAITNYIVALLPFMPLLAAALLSFVPCTACSGSPHNATHSASYWFTQNCKAVQVYDCTNQDLNSPSLFSERLTSSKFSDTNFVAMPVDASEFLCH